MTWLRSPRHFLLAVLFAVALFALPPRAVAQDKNPVHAENLVRGGWGSGW